MKSKAGHLDDLDVIELFAGRRAPDLTSCDALP